MQMSVTAVQPGPVRSSVTVASVIKVMFVATASLVFAAARKVRLGPKWKIRVSFNVKRPISDCHPHEFEWEDCSCGGLLNIDDNLVIVQTRDNAYDIEYYTREGALSYSLHD